MKPAIRLGFGGSRPDLRLLQYTWVCLDDVYSAYGYTPKEAWFNWFKGRYRAMKMLKERKELSEKMDLEIRKAGEFFVKSQNRHDGKIAYASRISWIKDFLK